jgi:hypothetical protein
MMSDAEVLAHARRRFERNQGGEKDLRQGLLAGKLR